jgi:hypothetical protein
MSVDVSTKLYVKGLNHGILKRLLGLGVVDPFNTKLGKRSRSRSTYGGETIDIIKDELLNSNENPDASQRLRKRKHRKREVLLSNQAKITSIRHKKRAGLQSGSDYNYVARSSKVSDTVMARYIDMHDRCHISPEYMRRVLSPSGGAWANCGLTEGQVARCSKQYQCPVCILAKRKKGSCWRCATPGHTMADCKSRKC